MTPDEARRLRDSATPGPWAFDPEPSIYPIESADGRPVVFQSEDAGMEPVPGIRGQDGHLIAAAPDMADTIIAQGEMIERVRQAILNPGVQPSYHVEKLSRLQQEWPTLYRAVLDLIGETP